MNSLVDVFRCSVSRSTTGPRWKAAMPSPLVLLRLRLGTAVYISSKASRRSSSFSFSERLPCTTWFSSAIRCSSRRLVSRSASRSRSTAGTAARWLSGMTDRSMDGAADVLSSHPDPTVIERFFLRSGHSATAGFGISRGRTRRQSRPAKSASNCVRLKVMAPSRTVGQVTCARQETCANSAPCSLTLGPSVTPLTPSKSAASATPPISGPSGTPNQGGKLYFPLDVIEAIAVKAREIETETEARQEESN